MATKKSAVLLMILCTVLTSFAQVFYKKAAPSLSFDVIDLITNYYLILGLFLYGIGAIIMIYAFKKGEVTVLYPIIALSYIWVSLLAVHFFIEAMNFYKWIAVIFIVIGIILIGIGGKDSETVDYEGIV